MQRCVIAIFTDDRVDDDAVTRHALLDDPYRAAHSKIRLTVIRELGHYFGMDENQLKDVWSRFVLTFYFAT
jgi:predicted Zn-dependent protease with MMP-like domain